MSISKGSKSKLLFAPETAFGTPATAVAYKSLFFSSESLVEQIETFQSQDIRPDRQTSAVRGGNIMSGGSVTSDFGIQRHALLLQHLLGISAAPTANVVTVATIATATPYTRGTYGKIGGNLYVVKIGGTYTQIVSPSTDFTGFTSGTSSIGGVTWTYVGADTVPVYHYTLTSGIDFPTVGLGFEKQVLGGSSALYVLFAGGRVDSLELSITQKDIVKATWMLEFLNSTSGSASLAAPSSVVLPTDDPVSGYDSFISLNSGTTVRPLRDATLGIKNNIEKDVVFLGNRVRSDLPEGMRQISGRFQTFFQDNAEYTLFKNETVIPLTISMLHGGEYISFVMGEVKLTGSGTPQISGQGVVSCSFDYTAFIQSGANDLVCHIYSLSNALFT